jgi:uncharacterized protein (UPF0332 family)
VSKEEAKRDSVHHWWKMAEEALQSARMEYEADLLHGAINRAYYAVFYAATALFVDRGLSFRKHAGVRAAVHRELIKKSVLSVELGVLYDRLFEDRQHGDYMVLTEFEPDDVKEKIERAAAFLQAVRALLSA